MKFFSVVLLAPALLLSPAFAHDQTAPLPKTHVAEDAFVWRFAPPVGSRWQMRWFRRTVAVVETPSVQVEFDSAARKSQRKPGKPFVTKSTHIQRFTADYDVLDRDALGATTIRLTYRSMADDVKSATEGMGQTPDSSRGANSRPIDGATLTFKQAPDGTIWSVLGARAFQRRMLEWGGNLNKTVIDNLLKVDDAILNAESMKLVNSLLVRLPASPVRVGESWAATMDLSDALPRPITLIGTRTLKSLSSDVALVADSAIVDVDKLQGQIPVVPGKGQMQFGYNDISGSISGTARVARASGLPLERQLDQQFKGFISTPLSDGAGKIIYVSTVRADVQTSTRIVLAPR